MVHRTRTLFLSGVLLLVPSTLAQTITTIGTEQDTLSTIIPGTCSATCATWLSSLGACPSSTATTTDTTDYNACVCAAAFVTAFTTCSGCMTTALTEAADPQAALPATGLTDLTAYCASVSGTPVAATSTTTAAAATTTATTTTTTTTDAASPAAATPVAASPTVSSSSTTAFNTTPTAVVITSIFQGQGFPTQTKSANVFTGGTQGRVQVALGALLVAAGAFWFA